MPVSSLDALAAPQAGRVAALIDARRGEVFAAVYEDGERTREPVAIDPSTLVQALSPGTLAVGDGAVRFREELERAGIPASVIAWLISVARHSRAPRQMPGDAMPELIWFGTSGRPVA